MTSCALTGHSVLVNIRRFVCLFALVLSFFSQAAVAQDSITNAAHVATPTGITDTNPSNNDSSVATPVVSVVTNKTSNIGTGAAIQAGGRIIYTVTANVSGGPLTNALVLTDTLSAGLTFDSITSAGAYTCSGTNPVVCTLPAGSAPGSYPVSYSVTVNANATGSVSNTVVPNEGTCGICSTTNPIVGVNTVKSSDVGTGTPVQAGQTITYTLTSTVTGGALTTPLVLTDTLSAGLTFGTVVSTGSFSCSGTNPVTCTLPANTPAGTYAVKYTVTVNANATATVSNTVVPNQGGCPTCSTDNPVLGVSTVKASDVGSGTPVQAGETITYTLTTSITGSALTSPLTLTDTLSAGLTFGHVTSAGAFSCSGSNPVVCTLPSATGPGTFPVSYTVTVNAGATGSVNNTVVPNQGTCPSCATNNPIASIITTKTSSVGNNAVVGIGQTLTYTVKASITGAALTTPLVLTDTLSSGLTFGSVTSTGAYTCNATNPVVCTLPTGTPPGSYPVSYTAVVNSTATTSVNNTVVPNQGDCVTCSNTNPLITINTTKSSDIGTGTPVQAGQTITYTLTATINGGALASPLTLSDTLSAGLTFGTVTSAGAYSCTGANPVVCTLPTGTVAGTYPVRYTATVNANATGSVNNTVVPNQGTCADCSTNDPVVSVITSKSANIGNGTKVSAGETITYTLTAKVTGGALTSNLVLSDTLGAGLTFGAIASAGSYNCNAANPLVCTLPTGTPAGSYPVSYTATVDSAATGSVKNTVVPNQGGCVSCDTDNPVANPTVTYAKAVALPSGKTSVVVGDTLTYTLTVTVANVATTAPVTLTDTLGPGLTFAVITSPGAFNCNAANPVVCTLPAGTVVGSYPLSYSAKVNAQASNTVTNAVVGSGKDNPTCITTCGTSTPVLSPRITVTKTSVPSSGSFVQRGDVIQYRLTALVLDAPTVSDLVLTDTPDPGLTIGALPSGCTSSGGRILCTLPTGTATGLHAFTIPAAVNAQAGNTVNNTVTADGGGPVAPTCTSCSTTLQIDAPQLLITKTAGVSSVNVGDLVRYSVQIQNVGKTNVVNGSILDTTPPGFSYVAGSLQVSSGSVLTVSGYGPVRYTGFNLGVGNSVTLVYLMRVGAGVHPGTQVNQAQAFSPSGKAISNVAEAQVTLTDDPLLDESLIFGTVFDDRDGDGWQDSAVLTHVQVKGGFAPEAYVPGTTTVDRGEGPHAEADASAPLLHGLALGALTGRQTDADPPEHHRVTISQRLSRAAFTDDFVMTDSEGVTVRLDADGKMTIERSGDAAKGLTSAAPTVERHVERDGEHYRVDYVIENHGVDERGIPGVRIASVEGLIVETDQFGRYHLAGIPGGGWSTGRNFVLKVDPSTLPPGSEFTTDNPLLRRITPGVPVRFDFGVKLPVRTLAGGSNEMELALGKVIFAPGSAVIRKEYVAAIDQMALRIREHGGGEVVIEADGETDALAFERASAVRTALLAKLDAKTVKQLSVSIRNHANNGESTIASLTGEGTVLGTVLFDTDKASIRPQFDQLLDQIAATLDRSGGGLVVVAGHTDVRGSHVYNTELGLRRAKAVADALATRLSPEVRAKTRVINADGADGAAPAQPTEGPRP